MSFINPLTDRIPSSNDPRVTRPTKIRRIGNGFMAHGRHVEPNEVVMVENWLATGLVQMQKAEYVS